MQETNYYRLNSMPSAQCHIKITRDDIKIIVELVSYSTSVLRLTYDPTDETVESNLTMQSTGTYSNTTARHINRFTREFLGKNMYHRIKQQVPYSGCPWHYIDFMYAKSINYILQFCDTVNNYQSNKFGIVKNYYGRY